MYNCARCQCVVTDNELTETRLIVMDRSSCLCRTHAESLVDMRGCAPCEELSFFQVGVKMSTQSNEHPKVTWSQAKIEKARDANKAKKRNRIVQDTPNTLVSTYISAEETREKAAS